MDFTTIGLIFPFGVMNNGYHYTLTVICMLTNYVFYVPLLHKVADTFINTCLKEVCCCIKGNSKLLSGKGSEFKNKLFSEVAFNGKLNRYSLHPTGHKKMED